MADFWLWGDGQTILWGDGQEVLLSAQTETLPIQQPTGGWDMFADVQRREQMRRRREQEREDLELTELQQRRLDRAAVKIARQAAKEGLGAARPLVMASPSFDAVLTALRPTEGMVLALADAILQRVIWMAEAQQADEEAALMALLVEL